MKKLTRDCLKRILVNLSIVLAVILFLSTSAFPSLSQPYHEFEPVTISYQAAQVNSTVGYGLRTISSYLTPAEMAIVLCIQRDPFGQIRTYRDACPPWPSGGPAAHPTTMITIFPTGFSYGSELNTLTAIVQRETTTLYQTITVQKTYTAEALRLTYRNIPLYAAIGLNAGEFISLTIALILAVMLLTIKLTSSVKVRTTTKRHIPMPPTRREFRKRK